jgi:hypothetical protein|tara:strand:+ start:254 stop:439 length:186 start_codon:yes stop_codon:yes gene_type:complete
MNTTSDLATLVELLEKLEDEKITLADLNIREDLIQPAENAIYLFEKVSGMAEDLHYTFDLG